MNTHEQYITLETAKLAKQAGFDWGINTVYKGEKLYTDVISFNWNIPREDFEKEGSDNLFHTFIQDSSNEFYSSPTQSVLQRWLREEKMVHIEIVTGMGQYVVWFTDCGKKRLLIENHKEATFNTYESALEAGLQKCLTLLIEKQ